MDQRIPSKVRCLNQTLLELLRGIPVRVTTGTEMAQRQMYHQCSPQHNDSSYNETYSAPFNLQASHQVEECPFL